MSTIRDVAAYAGVSVGTASKVLNDVQGVKSCNRDKVLAAIRDLDYRPSAVAQSLSRGWSNTIGVVIPDLHNPLYSEIVRGIEDRALSASYHVFLCNSAHNPVREADYIDSLTRHRIDGLIVVPVDSTARYAHHLRSVHVPLVLVERTVAGVEADSVVFDNETSVYEAMLYLRVLGHSRVAMINGPKTISTASEREQGFRHAYRDFKFQKPCTVLHGRFDFESGVSLAVQLWREQRDITAVVCTSALLALGVIDGFGHVGYQIPDDVSLVSCEDIPMFNAAQPNLTAIHQTAYDFGAAACEAMLKRLSTPQVGRQRDHIVITGHLEDRGSVRRLATQDVIAESAV